MGYNKIGCGGSGSGTTNVVVNVEGSGISTSNPPVTNNAVVRYDGTDGYVLQESNVTINDFGNITVPALATVDGIDISVADAYNKAELVGVNTDINNHIADTANPHDVTASQINALQYNDIDGYAKTTVLDGYESAFASEFQTLKNADAYSVSQLTAINADVNALDAYSAAQDTSTNTAINVHIADVSNPHDVTAAQISALQYSDIDGYAKTAVLDGYENTFASEFQALKNADAYSVSQDTAINTGLNIHISDTSNPHDVTASQISALQYADIDGYAKKTLLDSYATNSDLALKADLTLLDSYATNSDLDLKANLTLLDSYATTNDVALKADLTLLDSYATTALATTSGAGLLKTLSNVSTEFMNGQGNWATPAGGGGGGTTPDGYALMTWVGDGYAEITHAPTHHSGGDDAIKLDDLAAPDDNTDLNVSTTAHGLAPKLSNVSTEYLSGTGVYSTPAGGGGGGGIGYDDIDGYATKDWVADGYASSDKQYLSYGHAGNIQTTGVGTSYQSINWPSSGLKISNGITIDSSCVMTVAKTGIYQINFEWSQPAITTGVVYFIPYVDGSAATTIEYECNVSVGSSANIQGWSWMVAADAGDDIEIKIRHSTGSYTHVIYQCLVNIWEI